MKYDVVDVSFMTFFNCLSITVYLLMWFFQELKMAVFVIEKLLLVRRTNESLAGKIR